MRGHNVAGKFEVGRVITFVTVGVPYGRYILGMEGYGDIGVSLYDRHEEITRYSYSNEGIRHILYTMKVLRQKSFTESCIHV